MNDANNLTPTGEPETDPYAIVIAELNRRLDHRLDRIDVALNFATPGLIEMTKSLVTLSAGAIVFTFTLVQLAADSLETPGWPWLLPASWIFFTLTILGGVLLHGLMARARAYRVDLEANREDIEEAIRKLPFDEHFDQRVRKLFDDVLRTAERAGGLYDWIIYAVYVTFGGGIVSLVAFAIKNLPF